MEMADVLRLQAASGMGAEDAQMVVEGMAMAGACARVGGWCAYVCVCEFICTGVRTSAQPRVVVA